MWYYDGLYHRLFSLQAALAEGCPAGSGLKHNYSIGSAAQGLLLASLPQLVTKATPKTRSGMVAWLHQLPQLWLQLPGSWNGEPPMPAMRLRALVLWALCVSEVRFLSVRRDVEGNGMMAEIGDVALNLSVSNHIRHGTVSVFLHNVNARPWNKTHPN